MGSQLSVNEQLTLDSVNNLLNELLADAARIMGIRRGGDEVKHVTRNHLPWLGKVDRRHCHDMPLDLE